MCLQMRQLTLQREGQRWLTVEVPCLCCWQCRADRVKNWVGKCIAESKTSAAVDFVTLTYADVGSEAANRRTPEGKPMIAQPVEPGWAKALHYEDVQKYLKRIRKAGHKVRYVVAGEYGEQKGRAHWHILLFWQDGRPDRFKWKNKAGNWLYGNEWQDEFWHHGHVNYQRFSQETAKYVCKYLLKWDTKQEPTRQTIFRFSTQPGVGFNWICNHWAQLHVEQGLAPQSPHYSFPDVLGKEGKRRKFKMTPHCAVKFVQDFERRWYEAKGDHPPASDWCDKVLSTVAKVDWSSDLRRNGYRKMPDLATPNGEKVYFDEKLNAYYFDCGGFRDLRFYYSFDETGARAWERDLVCESLAEKWRRDRSSEMRNSFEVLVKRTTSQDHSRKRKGSRTLPLKRSGWSIGHAMA